MTYWLVKNRLVVILLALLCPITLYAGSISDLDDLFVGVWSPFGRNWEKSVPVCVTGDASETVYRVSATGLNSSTSFTVDNSIGDKARYDVFWHTGNGLKKRERLRPNTESRRSYQYQLGLSCSGSPNAKLRVKINDRDINRAVPAIYNDTLLITLIPI